MPKVNVSRVVKCPADTAIAVLADVGSYRHFLPFVRESEVTARSERSGREQATARLRVRYRKLNVDEQFNSEIEIDRAGRTLHMTSNDGPLKRLDALWTVVPAGADACEITLKTDLALKSLTLQFVLIAAMDYVVRKLFSAFEARALELQAKALA